MEKNFESDEIEIDLKEIFFELLARWKMIMLSIILVGAIAFSYTKFMVTPMYESTAQLYVLSKSTSITSLADLQTGTSLTTDYMVVVGGRVVMEQVIENLDLEEDYKELSAKLTINNPTNSRILELTVLDADPKRAKAIVDEIADVAAAYISDKMDQDPPNVIRYGYVEDAPASPNIKKNTAIGMMLGLLLAMGYVIVSYLLNDTIMTPDDVEKKLGLNLLATLPLDKEEYDGGKKKGRTKKTQKKKQARK